MLMTVRSYDEKVRTHLLESIKRQLNAEAAAVDAPSPPLIKVAPGAEAVYNDPEVTTRLLAALRRDLGSDSAVEMPAKMTSEDFSAYGRVGVRAVLLHIGAVNPEVLASGAKHPDLHSPQWFPELKPTLRSMVAAEVVMLTELLVAPESVNKTNRFRSMRLESLGPAFVEFELHEHFQCFLCVRSELIARGKS